MISLPKPYEDELLYSVVARAIAYLAPKHDFAVNRLIGRAQCSIFFGLPIDWLDGGIESAWGLSPQEIVERHTMFPFYGRFLPRTQFSAGMEIMLSGSRRNIATNLGLQNGERHSPRLFEILSILCARGRSSFWRDILAKIAPVERNLALLGSQ